MQRKYRKFTKEYMYYLTYINAELNACWGYSQRMKHDRLTTRVVRQKYNEVRKNKWQKHTP